ncbi:hypothetical protein IWX90DRAFT_115908 [Phyllosticta citrichinensis]|uniref:Uncharacterized protein n=1 Tax=Phyllosticta citrichinensis TaxID=1130410 RepID=A0ABR1Y322_9PEZI
MVAKPYGCSSLKEKVAASPKGLPAVGAERKRALAMDHPRPLAKRRPIFLFFFFLFFSPSLSVSSPERFHHLRGHFRGLTSLNSPKSRTAAVMGGWSSFSHHGSQQALPHRVPQPLAARGSFARKEPFLASTATREMNQSSSLLVWLSIMNDVAMSQAIGCSRARDKKANRAPGIVPDPIAV